MISLTYRKLFFFTARLRNAPVLTRGSAELLIQEMERFMTQYFSKAQDMERAFAKVCKLAGDDDVGAVTVDELTVAMTNLGFKLPEDKDVSYVSLFATIVHNTLGLCILPRVFLDGSCETRQNILL